MQKDDILRLLLTSPSGYVSGGDLAKKLKVSRTAIWKHIRALEDEGYEIEAVPSKGYRIMTIPDRLILHDIEQDLAVKIVGRTIRLLDDVPSTNTLAMEEAQAGAAEGTVIIAEMQTGGKGRLGRTWVSPRGNLYLSVVLRPPIAPHKAPLLTLMGAVAVASAVRKQLDVRAEIKWPNDIFVSGKKLGGLLTEMSAEPDRVRSVALGIGLNVNMNLSELPAEIRPRATTLAKETGGPVPRTELLQRILLELDRWYQVFLKNEALVLREWEVLNMTIGKQVTVAGPGETITGTAQGIDHDGRLILKLDNGSLRQVAAGDVTIVKK